MVTALRTKTYAAALLALLSACATGPASPPPGWPTAAYVARPEVSAVVEAACPSPLLFEAPKVPDWRAVYAACRGAVMFGKGGTP